MSRSGGGDASGATAAPVAPCPCVLCTLKNKVQTCVLSVVANLCYTLGSVTDLALRRVLGIRAPDLAPVLLRYGFVFSLGLTLLPIPVIIAVRGVMAVLGVGP